ncbi:hypothetical protein ACF0H5_011679 [Mactra antiquata]
MGSGSSKPAAEKNKTNNSQETTDPASSSKTDSTNTSKQTSQEENKMPGNDKSVSGNKANPEKPVAPSTTAEPKSDVAESTKESKDQDNSDKRKQNDKANELDIVEEVIIDEGPKEQMKFDCALRSACLLIKPESLYKHITKNVTKLQLNRALPQHFVLIEMLHKLENLKDLDLSYNNMGPQSFRAVCLAMCNNSTILSLNLSDNMADTDSADCVGRMLEENKTLQYLDVSSNYLGKDYFSRKCGPALKVNTSLKTLRCESIGSTDVRLLIDGLQSNTTLVDLDMTSNEIADSVGFTKGLSVCLKKPDCVISCISLSRCELTSEAVVELTKGLAENKTLCELNLTGAKMDNFGVLINVIVTSAKHPAMKILSLDSVKVKTQDCKTENASGDSVSALQVLSLNSCGLVDEVFTSLEKSCKGRLLHLVEIDITANDKLSLQCLDSLASMTTDEIGTSSIKRLRYGLNKGDTLHTKLSMFGNLQYLNLRLCHLSQDTILELGKYISGETSNISTLILDGLKLSGTEAIKNIVVNPKVSKLGTLSLGSCSLDDNDLTPLCDAIKDNLSLTMLKLSANRITDVGVAKLVVAFMKAKNPPLAVLDLSNNRLEDEGAKSLIKLCTSKYKLHSLNVSANGIGKEGMLALTSVVGGKSPLQTLHVQGQTKSQDEGHMIDIFSKLATSIGYKVQKEDDIIKPGCSDLPANLPDGLLVNITDMGGNTGNMGQALDSQSIKTDYVIDRLPSLSFNQIIQICCFLKDKDATVCVWSENDWKMIIGADRPTTDTPSWLQLADQRDRCIYINNLPGNATIQKLESILEMDCDCNVEETCLMKDPVTRGNNGVGWAVMSDQESVKKAIDYFNSGEAKIFGQAIMISEVKIKVDNEASEELQKKAIEDQEKRSRLRAKEESAHRTLIVNTTEASWKRHAYRLAHPAYADGRIW